jgi:DNA-binding GntR family transcriptional regulator
MIQATDLRKAKTSLSELAYRHLLSAIVAHELPPGAPLRPPDLAQRMGLSPTPVKDALARLAGEGLVEYRPGLGPFVAAPTVAEIVDLYGCRLMCELHALREGFSRIDEPFILDVRARLDAHEAALAARDGSYERQRQLAEADRDFHLSYLRLWPNAKAITWYTQLNVHIRSDLVANKVGGRPGTLVEHREIFDALVARDLERALGAVRRHVDASRDSFVERSSGSDDQRG